jgi:hypothetical protein
MAGRPTLTTEPSTNARLEARIVVASTRRGCGDVATRIAALAVAASQATLRDVLIVRFYGPLRSGAGHIRATLGGSATSNSRQRPDAQVILPPPRSSAKRSHCAKSAAAS